MSSSLPRHDVVMLGTFGAWNLGTIQARALPLARGLRDAGVKAAIVTTPWDTPSDAGTVDLLDSVALINTTSTSPANPLPAVMQQLRWVRRLSPAVVHVFKPKGFGGIAGRILQRDYPVVVDSDDWEGDGGWNSHAAYSPIQRRVFHHQERDLLRSATIVTAASTLLAERARRLRRDSAECSVQLLENGLERSRAEEFAGARVNWPSEIHPPVVVLYSRFAEFEADWLSRFIRALGELRAGGVTVRVIGDSNWSPASGLGHSAVSVELMGYVARHAVPRLLGSSTLAVYPYRDSLIARSKQSVKLLEQMAAGCPVIASDVGDVARTLGDAGVVVHGGDPEVFAGEANALLDRPRQLDRMSAAGIERVMRQYSFLEISRRLVQVYKAAGLPIDA